MGNTSPSKNLLIGVSALFLGIFYTLLFYNQEIGLNYVLAVCGVLSFGVFLSRVFALRLEREQYVLIALALFFSGMVFVRSSQLLTFLNIVWSTLLLLILIVSLSGRGLRSFLFGDYVRVPFLPFRFIAPFFETVLDMVTFNKTSSFSIKTKETIRGSVMAAIAVIIFSLLFASADAVFQNIVSHLFVVHLDENMFGRLVFGAIVSAFFIGAFSYLFKKTHPDVALRGAEDLRRFGTLESTIFLGAITLLFFFFIGLQFTYLFGGESHFLSTGLTYAEYTRKGFGELIMVALLSYVIIALVEKHIVKDVMGHLPNFRVLSVLLVGEVVCILVSAFMRLSLYEHAYGFSTLRLYSYALMILLAVVFVLLLQRIWANNTKEKFMFRVFCSLIFFLFAMNAINPDAFIAQRNLVRYEETGKLDVYYLASLSDDALPYTMHLIESESERVRKDFAHGLYMMYHDDRAEGLDGHAYISWQSLRISRMKARTLFAPYRALIEENKTWTTVVLSAYED